MSVALIIIPFLPASNLFLRVGFVIAERVLYLPSIGFCMLVVLGCSKLCQNARYKKVIGYIKFLFYRQSVKVTCLNHELSVDFFFTGS